MPERRPLRRAIGATRRGTLEREIDEELAFHLEMRTRQLVARGLSLDDATSEAHRQFGDLERVRASCATHDQQRLAAMRRSTFLDELRQDLAFAARSARRNPLFTLLVAFTIALGVGANTAIFSLVNAVLLRQLPVRAPQELMIVGDPSYVGAVMHTSDANTSMFGWKTYLAVRERSTVFSELAASGRANRLDVLTEQGQGEADHPRGRFVSGNYFSVLGVPALLGRVLTDGDDATQGGSPAVVVSHSYWTRRLQADPRVIGRELIINNARFTIVGVSPATFTGEIVGQDIDLFLPVSMQAVIQPNSPWINESDARWLQLFGRRRGGVTDAQAVSRTVTDVQGVLGEEFSLSDKERNELKVQVTDGSRGLSRLRATWGPPLLILLAGVALLLLLICANVANLLLARAMARGREMSVRLAIGAGRARLVRQLLTESMVLGLLGAAMGLVFARWGTQALVALASQGAPGSPAVHGRLDGRVLGFTALLCAGSVLLFGLVPAWRTSRVNLAGALRAGARSMRDSGGGRRLTLGNGLIAVQVALSLVLVVGASLLVRSLQQVQLADTGVDRDHLAVLEVDAQARGYRGDRLGTLARTITESLTRVPGVRGVTWSNNGIFSGTNSATTISIPGFTAVQQDDTVAAYDQVAAGYVTAIGGRMLRGRDFTNADVEGRAPVILINESMARFYFGAADPVGRTVHLNDSLSVSIVGVLADVRDQTLTGPVERRFYLPALGNRYEDANNLIIIVRTTGDPGTLMPQLRSASLASDPLLSIESESLSTLMAQSVREERLLARLATVFGGLALLLAAIGLYGVMSYAVARRTGEIGLRSALGASRRTVTAMVIADALTLTGIGLVVGVPAGIGAGQLLKSQLHGVQAADPVSLGVGLGVLLTSALLAALVPALRAARVSPMVALQRD